MKVTRNSDQSILLVPESEEEKIGLDYEWITLGPTFFKEFIEAHVKQRKEQKDYEELMSIFREAMGIKEADRVRILKDTLEAIEKAKESNG